MIQNLTMSKYFSYELVEELVKLKFCINQKMESCVELIKSIDEINLGLFSKDLDIVSIIDKYKQESNLAGRVLSEQQNSIYLQIDKILYEKCEHEWIHDYIEEPLERERHICYCKHCFYYKKK